MVEALVPNGNPYHYHHHHHDYYRHQYFTRKIFVYQSIRISYPCFSLLSFDPGKYLEIFARRNNLRNYWVSIGNEL